MEKWTWMAIRMLVPCVTTAVAGVAVSTAMPAILHGSAFGSALRTPLSWFALGLFVMASVMLARTIFVFWQWETGRWTRLCPCSGVLGAERRGRWGPYRRCYACGRNVSAKHYE